MRREYQWKVVLVWIALAATLAGSTTLAKQFGWPDSKHKLLWESAPIKLASQSGELSVPGHSAARWIDREDLRLTTLPAPPFHYQLFTPTPNQATNRLVLRLINSKPNSITDDNQWLQRNDLALPIYTVPNPFQSSLGDIPAFIPEKFRDQIVVTAIRCKKTILLIYGVDFGQNRYLIAVDSNSGDYRYGFDFVNYSYSPQYLGQEKEFINQRIYWAFEENNILYVSHAHSTYAKSSMGLNAYITAIDIESGKLLWRTKPLVSNSINFEIVGDTIITGYGFTDEPDYLYLLDKKTGEIYKQVKLKSGPSYMVLKGNQLHVRTYNTDYLFQVDGS